MNISSKRELIWTLELTDNEMAVLHNYLHDPKMESPEDQDVLENIRSIIVLAEPPPRN